jgi:hypothetical protein
VRTNLIGLKSTFFVLAILLAAFGLWASRPTVRGSGSAAVADVVRGSDSRADVTATELAREPIKGEYAEARTCDVWTGPCFANGEMNLRGDHAVLAWSIDRGREGGVDLSGLRVVASVDAEGTLGSDAEGRIRTVLFIDERASDTQAAALVSVVGRLAPRFTREVVALRREPITFAREGASVRVEVGSSGIVRLETRPLSGHCDSICGNEAPFYPALTGATSIECAKTVANAYGGNDLGLRWSHPNARSAMVGSFEL